MTIYRIFSLIARLLGFVQLAGQFWRLHELRLKAREIANTPTTRPELEKSLMDGEL